MTVALRTPLLVMSLALATVHAAAQSSSPKLPPLPGAPAERSTPHLRLAWYAVPERLTPDRPVSLVVEVTPAPGMRVYAPGQLDYIGVGVTLDPNPAVTFGPPRLPKPVEHLFAPTGERSLVFDRPFRIDVAATMVRGKAGESNKPNGALKIEGTFQYQACDDAVCYRPVRIPVSWTLDSGPAAPKHAGGR
jgi:hypothetical protein